MSEADNTTGLKISDWVLGTVLLEKNRWKRSIPPSLSLIDWIPAIQNAGFDALELWEFHYLSMGEAARRQLIDSGVRFPIFNTYSDFLDTPEHWERLEHVRGAVVDLGCYGIKFNVAQSPEKLDESLSVAQAWAATLPAGVRLLCECHGGTPLEVPSVAGNVFKSLPEDRFAAIIHPLQFADGLEDWLNHLGSRIVHLHIQARDENNKFCTVASRPELVEQAGKLLDKYGFSGSVAMEFAKGCATADETPQDLLEVAVLDRESLKKAWL